MVTDNVVLTSMLLARGETASTTGDPLDIGGPDVWSLPGHAAAAMAARDRNRSRCICNSMQLRAYRRRPVARLDTVSSIAWFTMTTLELPHSRRCPAGVCGVGRHRGSRLDPV